MVPDDAAQAHALTAEVRDVVTAALHTRPHRGRAALRARLEDFYRAEGRVG